MARTIGIDLGTTNTVIAVFQNGRPKVLEDEKGYKVLPSVVSQKDDGSYIVGQAAKNRILTHPDTTVYAVKRLVGRRFDSQQAQDTSNRMPYDLVEGPDGSAHLLMGDTEMSPVEVSSIVLKVARQVAERALGEPVEEAVITVPAYFNHQQRQATMEAAALAGLRCDRLLNEPTAAALAYGHRKDVERNVVIFDLGGGTFDVSVLHLSSGVYEVLSTSGDTYLGGEDFDLRIVDWLADKFLSDHRVDLREDATALQRLKDAAERAKCELSFTDRVTVMVPRITSGANLEYPLSRAQLEKLCADMVDRTIEVTREAVAMAGLQLRQIDDIVLVGGQTRMPRMREAIASLFGKEPSRSVHPEEVVAIGAAVHAQSLDSPDLSNTLLIDVTPFDLGIDSAGGFFSTIIERNTRIPFTRTRTFTTASENQERVRITVRQGASRVAKENEFLGEFVLEGLRSAGRMEQKLDVTFRIDANGILHTSCVDRLTGDRKQLVIKRYNEAANSPSMPSDEDIAREEERRRQMREALGDADASESAAAPVDREFKVPEKKGGFLASLFGGSKKDKEAPAPAAPPVDPEEDVPDDLEPEALGADQLEELGDELQELDEESIHDPDSYREVETVRSSSLAADPAPDTARIAMPAPPAVEELGAEAFEDISDADSFDDLLEDIEDLRQGPVTLSTGGTSEAPPASDEVDALDDLGDPFADDDLGDPFADDVPLEETSRNLGLDDLGDLGTPQDLDEVVDERPAILEEDLFYPEDMFGAVDPEPMESEPESVEPEPEAAPQAEPAPITPKSGKKPARLKISYRTSRAFVKEYRQNLADGHTFIKAAKPLKEGRECLFEISVPELGSPLTLRGVVTWSSRRRELAPGEEEGMRIEYQLEPDERSNVEGILTSLAG